MILRKYGTIKGKLSQKISAIVEEHKFFTENKVCPTCEQDIEESFHINRIGDSQDKAKELQKGFEELKQQSKKKNKESPTTSRFHWRLLHFLMAFLRTILKSLHVRNKSEILNLKFKQLTTDQKIEILNMTS